MNEPTAPKGNEPAALCGCAPGDCAEDEVGPGDLRCRIRAREKQGTRHSGALPEPWQPIETAPKDGSKFLAYRRGDVAQALCIVRADGEVWQFGATSAHADVYPKHRPTHWMPLPEPPR